MPKLPDQKQDQDTLAELKSQESTLQHDILRCEQAPQCNQVQLGRLKKQLMTLQEQIKQLKSSLIPDQPA